MMIEFLAVPYSFVSVTKYHIYDIFFFIHSYSCFTETIYHGNINRSSPILSLQSMKVLNFFYLLRVIKANMYMVNVRANMYTVNVLNFEHFIPCFFGLILLFMLLSLKMLSEMANSVDPDQTAPKELVRPNIYS